MKSSLRTWCGVFLAGFLVLLIAVLATRHLPVPRQYESRYEFRVRDYQKNIDQPEAVLNGLELIDSRDLCRFLSSQHSQGCDVAVWCDNTEKITLRVRHNESETAQQVSCHLFAMACDTVNRFGDSMCVSKAAEYRRHIDSLKVLPHSVGVDSLLCSFADRLAILESDAQGGMKYLEVLNPSQASVSVRTPSRWLLVLVSFLSAVVLSCGFVLLKNFLAR